MPQPADDSRSLGSFAPALVLLAIGVLINYIDRGNISIAGPLLKRELGLSASQLGILFAAFFSTYTAMQFVVGPLVDRLDANRILAAGFLLWSLATAATGVVRGFVFLLAMRLILGIGESVAFPATIKIMARHLPEHHRGFASGVLLSATKWGNAIGLLSRACLWPSSGGALYLYGLDLSVSSGCQHGRSGCPATVTDCPAPPAKALVLSRS